MDGDPAEDIMSRMSAAWGMVLVLVFPLSGCYTTEEVTRGSLTPEDEQITEVLTTKGRRCVFRKDGDGRRGTVRDSVVVGLLKYGNEVAIPLSQISRAWERRFDATATVGWTAAGLVVAGVIAVFIWDEVGITMGR
jgi:hypothetical protein